MEKVVRMPKWVVLVPDMAVKRLPSKMSTATSLTAIQGPVTVPSISKPRHEMVTTLSS